MRKDHVVLLWWGKEVRLLTADGTIAACTAEVRGDPVKLIARMLAEKCPKAGAARIIYQPASLEIHSLACPPVSRSQLQAVLAADYPALNLPHAVWSVEPVRGNPDGSGHSTLLYIDNRFNLPRLLGTLDRLDIEVEGVWPLQTLIESTPPCDGVDFLGVIAIGAHSLVSCASPSGSRYLRFQDEAAEENKMTSDLHAAMALFDGAAFHPGLLVIEDTAIGSSLREAVRDVPLDEIPFGAFLANARRLKPGGFSDFLHHKPFYSYRPTLSQIAAVVGLTLSVGSAWTVYEIHERANLLNRRFAAFQAEQAELERLVESRRATKMKLDSLDHDLALVPNAPQHQGELMRALNRATPAAISLESLLITGDNFTIKGRVYEGEGMPSSPLIAFCQNLAGAGASWRLLDPPPAQSTGSATKAATVPAPSESSSSAFTLHGVLISAPAEPSPHA